MAAKTTVEEELFVDVQKELEKDEEITLEIANENENTVYECSSCSMSFSNVEEHLLQYHEHGDKDEPIEEDAGDPVEEVEDVLEDVEGMAFVVKNADGKFECQECYKTYKSVRRFIDHVKTHGSVAEENILKLEEHLQQLNNDNEIVYEQTNEALQATKFRCKICNTVFDTRKKVLLHFPIHKNVAAAVKKGIDSFGETSQETSLHCKLCNRSLGNANELKMHMNAHTENHTQDLKKPAATLLVETGKKKKKKGESCYPCQYCQKEFSRPHEKVKHERIHTGEKPYSCDICGKQFRVTYCLSLHKKNVHSEERPFVCSFEGCNKRFKSQSVYNHHLNTHGSAKNYKCPYCSKAFKTSVQLAGHKNTHTKPFPCQVCGRAFASLYAVKIHMENHRNVDNNLKYNCKLCPAQYGRSFALSDHIKTAHDMEVEEAEEHYVIEETQEITVDVEGEVYSVVV